jgi:hypothetical protein
MSRVHRPGPGAEGFRDAAVVLARASDGRVVGRLLGENQLPVSRREHLEVHRPVLPADIRNESSLRRDGVEERTDHRLGPADHPPERRHPAVDQRHRTRT